MSLSAAGAIGVSAPRRIGPDTATNRIQPAQADARGNICHPIFSGVDGHGRAIGQQINALETLAFEAMKSTRSFRPA